MGPVDRVCFDGWPARANRGGSGPELALWPARTTSSSEERLIVASSSLRAAP